MTALFEVDDVTRSYGGRGHRHVLALDHVSLALAEGDRLGIVGESGSGKTTLLRLLAGLDAPTTGAVRFRGTPFDVRDAASLRRLRGAVQLVFQDPMSSLDPRLRVRDIVGEPLRKRGRAEVARRVDEVLDAVGLPADAARRYPHEFSGGQRQRIAIARALAPAPAVLLADEPVSALDVSVRAHILNLLMDLVTTMGLALVLVSHDLAVVRHLCDTIVVLRGGRVVERGVTSAVYDSPRDPYTRDLLDSRLTI